MFFKKKLIIFKVLINYLLKKPENLKFLTFNRVKQYLLLSYILDNNIIHWENVKYNPTILKN